MQISNFSVVNDGNPSARPSSVVWKGFYLFIISVLLCLFAVNADAWQVTEAFRIENGFTSMCAVDDQLWCGSVADDTTITIFDSNSGEVVREVVAPEGFCGGLAYRAGNIWYLGANRIYRLNSDGDIISQQNLPVASMVGLTPGDNGLWTIDLSNGDPMLALFNVQGAVVRRIAMRVSDAIDLHFDGANFWISSPPNGFVHRLGADGATINIFPTPANTPTAITMIGSDIYLIDNGDDQAGDLLYKIDPESEPSPRLLPGSQLHDFGLVQVFAETVWDLSIYNVGGVDLRLNQVFLGNGGVGYTLGQLPQQMVIAPGRFLLARVNFSPQSYGVWVDTLYLHCNDPVDSVVTVILRGIGVFGNRTLGMSPSVIDFGNVRADIRRDGSKHLEISLINKSSDEVVVQEVSNRIPEIFSMELPEFPDTLFPTDTLNVRIWFTPHRAIQYIDTLSVRSSAVQTYIYGTIRGQGDARVYEAGDVLWQLQSETEALGNFAIGKDINLDGIREVAAVTHGGIVQGLNGFSSEAADPIWSQHFRYHDFSDMSPAQGVDMFADVPLSHHNAGDVLFASGGEEATVYALSGDTGELLWRWVSGSVLANSQITGLFADEDITGNGIIEPIVLVTDEENHSCLARLDGETGRTIWYREFDEFEGVLELRDLTGDQLSDFVIFNRLGNIITVNGANGRSIRSYLVREFVEIAYLNLHSVGDRDLLVISDAENSVSGIDLITGQTVWAVNEAEGIAEFGIVTCFDVTAEDNVSAILCGDTSGNLIKLGSDGAGIGRNVSQSAITVIRHTEPLYPDSSATILFGTASGSVGMVDASNLQELWHFQDAELMSPVTKVDSFDDVDVGGTNDVLAMLENGTLLCISTAGDVSNSASDYDIVPRVESLSNLYPNPFNGNLRFNVDLNLSQQVSITIYDLSGRQIFARDFGTLSACHQTLEIESADLGRVSGTIYIKTQIGSETKVMRGVYLK